MTNRNAIGTDIEGVPEALLAPNIDSMSKAHMLRDIHAGLGTKDDPTIIDGCIQIHPDSCGVEFTTPPVDSASDLLDAIRYSQHKAEELIGMPLVFVNQLDLHDVVEPLAAVAPDVLETLLKRGCDPDWHIPEIGAAPFMRPPPGDTSSTVFELGGHIHADLPEHLDAVSAATLLGHMLEGYHDDSPDSWYRVPRLYRPKPYGLEYRSLGASWAGDEQAIHDIFNAVDGLINQ
jgi:hypothetical protein